MGISKKKLQDGRIAIVVCGELNFHSTQQTYKEIEQILKEDNPDHIIVDLVHVPYVDTSGIMLLVRLCKNILAQGGEVETYANEELGSFFKSLRLDGMLNIKVIKPR